MTIHTRGHPKISYKENYGNWRVLILLMKAQAYIPWVNFNNLRRLNSFSIMYKISVDEVFKSDYHSAICDEK